MKEYSVKITAVNAPFSAGSVVLYEGGEAGKVFPTDAYSFSGSLLLTFDKDGKIAEIGNDLRTNPDQRLSSPQLGLPVPAGGFSLAFDAACPALMEIYEAAMADGVIYCSTMSMPFSLFPLRAAYCADCGEVTLSCPEKRAMQEGDLSVLAVGNSNIYFNGTPLKYMALAKAAGKNVYVEYCTRGAAKLSEFASDEHPWGRLVREKLTARSYDFVVLQDYGATTYEEMSEALAVLLPLVRENGAKPLLYIPAFGALTSKQRIDETRAFSMAVAKENGMGLASGNHAFEACRDAWPEIELWADDKAHQSKEGSYLAACCWLKSYLDIDPVGNAYTADLTEEVAQKLQQIAKEASLAALQQFADMD